MAIQKAVLQDLINYLYSGGEPLNPQQFYDVVLTYTNDPGTALLICHNLTKALSWGSDNIAWERISPNEDNSSGSTIYKFDGQEVPLDDLPLNPKAQADWGGRPSIFYRLFDATFLGTNDPGDWYHYYLTATAAYYGATGRIDYNDYGLLPSYNNTVGREISNVMKQFGHGQAESDAYKGFRFANALSFLEGVIYGADYAHDATEAQAETSRESRLHLQGTLFGLEISGNSPADDWLWNVPQAGSVDPSVWNAFWGGTQIDDVSNVTYEQLEPTIDPSIALPVPDSTDIPDTSRRGENARRDR